MMEQVSNVSVEQHQEVLFKILCVFDDICRKYDIQYVLFAGTMLGAIRHHGFIPWDDDLDVLMLRKDYDKLLNVANEEFSINDLFLQREFSKHWPMFFSKLRMNNTTCLEKYHPKDSKSHQGIYIDIFPCDNLSDNKVIRKLQFYSSKIVIAKSLFNRGYDTDNFKKKLFMQFCRLLPIKPFLSIAQNRREVNSKMTHSFLGGSSSFDKSIYKREYLDEIIYMDFNGKKFPVSTKYDEWLTTLYNDYMVIPSIEERSCKKHSILVDLNQSWEKYEHYRDDIKFTEFTRSIR